MSSHSPRFLLAWVASLALGWAASAKAVLSMNAGPDQTLTIPINQPTVATTLSATLTATEDINHKVNLVSWMPSPRLLGAHRFAQSGLFQRAEGRRRHSMIRQAINPDPTRGLPDKHQRKLDEGWVVDNPVPKWHQTGMKQSIEEPRKRITARVSDRVSALLEQAAELSGATVNQFVVQTAYLEAQRMIERETLIRLSQKDAQKILSLLDHPPRPNKTLKQAVKTHRNTVRAQD